MAKLRLGVIGAGSWAVASHLPNLAKRRDEVEFVAVARKGELLQKVKDDWGFAVASEDYRDVIAAGIDICVVASPTAFHYEHAKAALESGAHVLIEKPITVEPAQAWERGELLSATGAYPDAAPDSVPDPGTWADPALSGGGYAQAQLSHALGLALWLTGLRGEAAFALMSTVLDSPVEHYDACALRFTNGAIGTLAGGSAHLGYDGNKHQLEARAIGSEGHFVCDLQRELVWIYRPEGGDTKLPVEPGDGVYDCAGPP